MKLLALLLLIQPCYAQLLIANAADGSTTNFAPGSLILVAATSTPTLTIAPSTNVPVLTAVAQGIFLARIPPDLPLGPATINGTGINILASSFAIFTGPISAYLQNSSTIYVQQGPHFAQKNNGPPIGLTQPSHPGDYLTIYGTGLGNATPDQISVSVAGLPVPVTYAGPAPGEPGVDQINVLIPPGLAVPDSCNDAFAITIAGTPVAPQPLSYTQAAARCTSPFGFSAAEMAAIDAGAQVPFVKLALQSSIYPADNVGAGFTRLETAQSLISDTDLPAPLNFADSAFYACPPPPQQCCAAFALLGYVYQGLVLQMGAASIPIGLNIPLPTGVPSPEALPPSIFQPGTWQLSAPNFSQSIQIPPTLQLESLPSPRSIDRSRDLTVMWDPSGYSSSDVVTVTVGDNPFRLFTSTGGTCNARATAGSVTIPAAQLKLIPAAANLTAIVSVHPDATPNFRLPQPDGSTLPLQFTYSFSETFPVTLHQ